jgi:hypothetical protein
MIYIIIMPFCDTVKTKETKYMQNQSDNKEKEVNFIDIISRSFVFPPFNMFSIFSTFYFHNGQNKT